MEPLSTVSDESATLAEPASNWAPPAWAVFAAAALAVGTIVRLGLSADSVAWALVQVVLVGIAAYDFASRRIKNVVTVPVSVLAVLLRIAFDRSALAEVVITGLVCFLAVFALSVFLRGGLGMGDVKLAGMLGFVLGEAVVTALFIGAVAGGIAAAVLLFREAGRKGTIAYGPYLAIGGMAAILLAHPPQLV